MTIVLALSRVNCVRNGGKSSGKSQPSFASQRVSFSKRPLAFDKAPRPRWGRVGAPSPAGARAEAGATGTAFATSPATLVRGRVGALAGIMSIPTAISMRFCSAAVLIAAVSGFVGMTAFSSLSCYCRVSGMCSQRDCTPSVILQTSMDTECSVFEKKTYAEQSAWSQMFLWISGDNSCRKLRSGTARR